MAMSTLYTVKNTVEPSAKPASELGHEEGVNEAHAALRELRERQGQR